MPVPWEAIQSTLLSQGLTIFLLIGWCLITAGVGRFCLSMAVAPFFSRAEHLFLSFGVGLVATAYSVFVLCIAQSLNTVAFLILMSLLGLLAVKGWFHTPSFHPPIRLVRLRRDRTASFLLLPLLAAGLLLVLAPETGKDALIYHLAVPKLYLLHQGFYFIPGNVFAGYPLLAEMHYILALFLQYDILAKAMHYVVFCGTLLGIGLFTRFLMREHALPAFSILIFASIPSVFVTSHTAYNDLFVTFFTLAALYAFVRWTEGQELSWIIISAVFSGSAAACKYTALLLTPLGCLGILWLNARRKTASPKAMLHMAIYTCVAFIAGSPFYLKNWITMGNPVYPFFYDFFGGPGWDAHQARLYDLFIQNLGMGRDLGDYLLLPWNLSFRARMDSPLFDGILGPIFFLTLPFLAGKRHWEMPIPLMLVYVFLTFLFWASSAQQLRYLIPLFPLLAIVTGAILTRYGRNKPIFFLLMAFVTSSVGFNGYYIVHDFLKARPLDAVIGIETRDAYLTRSIPSYLMYRFINHELPMDSRVLLIYMKNFTFLCDRTCYADAMFETYTLQKILGQSRSTNEVRDQLKQARFTHLLYDENYLLYGLSPLSPEEKRLFLSFREKYLVLLRQTSSYRLDRLD